MATENKLVRASSLKTAYDDLSTKISANTSKSHTHSNKAVLDGITQAKVNAWDSASSSSESSGATIGILSEQTTIAEVVDYINGSQGLYYICNPVDVTFLDSSGDSKGNEFVTGLVSVFMDNVATSFYNFIDAGIVCSEFDGTDTFNSGYELISSSNEDVTYLTPTTAKNKYATITSLSSHTTNSDIHVTSSEKSIWNAKQDALTADTDYLTPTTAASTYQPKGSYAALSNLTTHTNNSNIHVTSAQKTAWDTKADVSDIPTKLSALSGDSTHRLVTDSQITKWDAGAATTTLYDEKTLRSGYLTLTSKTWTNVEDSSVSTSVLFEAGIYLIEQTAQIRSGSSSAGFVLFRPVSGSTEITDHRDAAPTYGTNIYTGWSNMWILRVTVDSWEDLSFQAYGSAAHWVGNCVQRIWRIA